MPSCCAPGCASTLPLCDTVFCVWQVAIGGLFTWPGSALHRVLHQYGSLPVGSYGPASAWLNAVVVRRPALVSAFSWATLAFECVVVPAALLMPPSARWTVALASVALHVGIVAVQSCGIGIAFLPNVAAYAAGFGTLLADVHVGSGPWAVAVAITAVALAPATLAGRFLPESWPWTPFALFPWSGRQWSTLFDLFATGDTRLVIYPASRTAPLVGVAVAPKDGPASPSAVHDGWEHVMGETIVHGPVLDALRQHVFDKDAPNVPAFCTAVQHWLAADRRMVELATGTACTRCAVVRVDDGGRIGAVLCAP